MGCFPHIIHAFAIWHGYQDEWSAHGGNTLLAGGRTAVKVTVI
jgi:hypothetical protein